MDFDKSIVDEFVAEAKEHLETVEDDLMSLEGQIESPDSDLINKVFRAVHTVKGSAGFMGLTKLAEVAHASETILSLMRTGEIKPESTYIDVLLQATDMINTMLDSVDTSNDMDIVDVMKRLEGLLEKDISPEVQSDLGTDVQLADTEGHLSVFKISRYELRAVFDSYDHLYVLKYNLADMSVEKGVSPVSIIKHLEKIGEIVEGCMDTTVTDLRAVIPADPLLYDVLFATMLTPDALKQKLEMDDAAVIPIQKETVDVSGEEAPEPAPSAPAETPRAGREETVTIEEALAEVARLEAVEKELAEQGKMSKEAGKEKEKTMEGEKVFEDTAGIAVAAPEGAPKKNWDGIDRRGTKSKENFDGSDRRKETIRIKLEILDQLMRLAGELVLVRNQQILSLDKSDPTARANVQRLDIVTSEIQETIMATRMQPIGNLFNRFPRIVRDLGKKLNKQIDIAIIGSEVELDNTILEALSDPLTHLVRNCCDHAIEDPDLREKIGKPVMGQIKLSAYHESGQINIEIRDDGKGIDPQYMRRKALEKGMKTEVELAKLSDKELVELILLPGFSTAEKLSDVSGRGVGMDVVKTSIESLGGTLEIDSSPGKGTKIYMRLPLTLAIIPCLMVKVGDYRFAIPQVNLEELVCLYDEDVITKIECAGNKEVYRLRDHLLPLVRIHEVLGRSEPFTENVRSEITENYRQKQKSVHEEYLRAKKVDEEGTVKISQSLNFAVLKIGANRFGLIVDSVLGTEEIVVKPMHPAIKDLQCYAGATVLGDGMVALILDVQGIARHVGLAFENREDITSQVTAKVADTQTVLLFNCGEKEQFAVPLPLIQRIETITRSKVQEVGGKEYVTIDGVSTRILNLDKLLNVSPCIEKEEMHLILPKHAKLPFGILVSRLVDTAETSLDLNVDSYIEDGLLGTLIIKDMMTLFLDVETLIEKAEPDWFEERRRDTLAAATGMRVLLVEDTSFYRQMVKGYLTAAGFQVVTAENGQEALDRLENTKVDLIVSDIEMPVMDGFTFMRNFRSGQRQNDLPAIALSSLSSDADKAKALDVGFNRFESKLKKDSLLTTVMEVLRGEPAATV